MHYAMCLLIRLWCAVLCYAVLHWFYYGLCNIMICRSLHWTHVSCQLPTHMAQKAWFQISAFLAFTFFLLSAFLVCCF